MSKGTRWLIGLALASSTILMLWLAVFDWAAWVCRAPAADAGKPLAAGLIACAEFWINRYQTLVGAIVAVGAAYVAWVAVRKQIEVGRAQIAIALGDIEPEMWIQHEKGKTFSGTQLVSLHILNNNRRPLQIDGLELIGPTSALMTVNDATNGSNVVPVGAGAIARQHRFRLRMHGTRPSAPEVSRKLFLLNIATMGQNDAGTQIIRREIALVRLHYTVLGGDIKSCSTDLSCMMIFNS